DKGVETSDKGVETSDKGVETSGGDVGASKSSVPSSSPPPSSARRLFDWHLANVEFSNSDTLDRSSFRHWDQDDPHEMQGSHCFVPGGHSRWVHRLCEGLPIFYDSPVRELCYGSSGVVAHCDGRSFSADAAVVTLPLGVLQAGSVTFSPALPPRKSRAIARMRFGTLNKVALLFPRAFWGDQIDMFGRLPSSSVSRGEAFLFYSSAGLSGGAVLIALMAGRAAVEHEKRPAAEA
ncbi:flavin containing amine oxidoreductase, partial [Helicosporidium sp. ATCC 50920]